MLNNTNYILVKITYSVDIKYGPTKRSLPDVLWYIVSLCNKAKSLRVLGLKRYDLPLEEYRGGELLMRANWERIREIVTPIYEQILLEAVKEQGIQCELIPNTSTGKLDLVPCQTS